MKKARTTVELSMLVLAVVLVAVVPLMAQDWPMFGQNVANTASITSNISIENVNSLKPRWTFTTGGNVSARAAVVNGVAIFPDWGGNLWAVDADDGKLIWSHKLSDYGLASGTVSRTSPAVVDGIVYIGTLYLSSGPTGWLLAIEARSGKLVWKTQPDTSNSFPVITGSPAVVGGVVYVGMTSHEEGAAAESSYNCCSVIGSIVALNATTGAKLWQTFTAPDGYSGASIWSGTPVVDTARQTVFVATGNNYSAPKDSAYTECIAKGGTEASCLSPDDHADSIIALDMKNGAIKWATRLMTWDQTDITNGSDFWNVSCIEKPYTNCPAKPVGPDYDFGSGANEITYKSASGSSVTIIGAGQKSGIYYALNPDTGAGLWHTQVGPGSGLGGIQWGSASDGVRIYVAISNYDGISYAAGSAGSWAALDPATGKILWQVADPNGSTDIGPVTVANGVVYVESMAGKTTEPTMLALNAATGKTLWSFAAGSSVIAGATVAQSSVFWGSGFYGNIPGYTGNTKFYAFTIQ